MKMFNKLLNIVVVIALIITTFMPPMIVHAVNMDLPYKVYMYYPSSSTDNLKVEVDSYNTYNEAKNKVDSIDSKPNATAGIEYDGRVIYADYALTLMDGPRGQRQPGEYVFYIYPTSARNTNSLASIAGSWGVDAAFLDYDPTYNSVKVKVSGLTGWVSLNNVTIKPIAAYYGYTDLYRSNSPRIYVTASVCINLRTSPNITNDNKVSGVCAEPGREYSYSPEKTVKAEGYTWYYANINGNVGYVASEDETWIIEKDTLLTDTFYYVYNNDLYHNVHMGISYPEYYKNIGEAPRNNDNNFYLKNSSTTNYLGITNRYLSFDSNYFYDDFKKMIDDYRNDTYENAINYEYPYYSYFMYVPAHTITSITKEALNNDLISNGITSPLTHEPSYYYNSDGTTNNPIGSESILYNTGELFIEAANTYGINPLAIYSAALRESGNGRSAIAILKNNLFGFGAADDDPFNKAYTFPSILDSIMHHANIIGGESGYTDMNDYRYHGTHKGNKLSGNFVFYMTDPYGGEKDASKAYEFDKNSGSTEINSNTLGIKFSHQIVPIYKTPSKDSSVIYETKNYYTGYALENMPFIVVDKVYTFEDGKNQGYYKIYTDVSLNSNQDVSLSEIYKFTNSYGYIKEEDLYVKNNQPVITASNIEIKQFDELEPMNGVSATDKEDGNLEVTYTSDVDTTKIGEYSITYTTKDRSNFSSSKTVSVTVLPTDAPIIEASDIEISAYKTFNPLENVKVTDNHYGDITNKLEVIENTVNINKTGIYSVTYSATNDSNVTSTKTIKVTVIANQKPIINASNITKYVDDSFDPLEGVTATDKEDGVLTNITVEGEVDTSTVGEYLLTYKVKDLDNQETVKSITVTVEEREYVRRENVFYLDKLLYNEDTKKIDFQGFLIIKGMDNNTDTPISYSIIFENQDTNERIVKPLSRLTSDIPFDAPVVDGYANLGAWFTSNLDITDLSSGDYNVYVRARSGNYEALVNLKNPLFNSNVSKKFSIDNTGYQFRINYFSKTLAMELMVREEGLIASKNNPTIDNMYNQLYSIELNNTKLSITASSHNVGGDYGIDSNIERYMTFENVITKEKFLTRDIGYITNGPYKISLKVDDGFDKTKAWYSTEIDLKDLQPGTYAIIVRTKTNNIDDYGEIYDILNSNLELSSNEGGKKISVRVNKNIRYRIEVTIE